jgi:hypothetical protein
MSKRFSEREVENMTSKEAHDRAARLGLSAWQVEAVAAENAAPGASIKCVGFESIDFPLAEAETWKEAFHLADRIIFGA